MAERKKRLLLEGGLCRVGLLESQAALKAELHGSSLLRSALRGVFNGHGSALLAPALGPGIRALRVAVPAAASWLVRKQLRRPLLIATSVSSLLLLWARSSKRKKMSEEKND